MQGKIIKWDDEKGFGFIKSEEQTENISPMPRIFATKHYVLRWEMLLNLP